jgi:putative Holliday junction resolvase
MGFDVGRRRTGVAVGQTITGTASSVDTLLCEDGIPDWHLVENLIHEWHPDALVVGVPYEKRDNKGDLHKLIRRFCRCLRDRYAINVYTHDESHTSVEAYRRLRAMRQAGRAKRIRKTEIDSLSAAILLESWMAYSKIVPDGVG